MFFSQVSKIIFKENTKKNIFTMYRHSKFNMTKILVRSDVHITSFSQLFGKNTEILQIYEFFFGQNLNFLIVL
jgi:hypothetical protein